MVIYCVYNNVDKLLPGNKLTQGVCKSLCKRKAVYASVSGGCPSGHLHIHYFQYNFAEGLLGFLDISIGKESVCNPGDPS